MLRIALAATVALTAVVGLGPNSALADDLCPAGRVLNIVAHHDDDLLFLSPDLIHDIQAGKCVQTLFLIASDYPNGRPFPDEEYMENRERGVRDAYATAAGEDPDSWYSEHYQAGSKEATQWTLNDRVSIVEVRISDNATGLRSDLWWLYALDKAVTTRTGTENPPQTFNRREVGDFLRQIVTNFGPDEIHAGDPLADHRTDQNHPDHVATARLVRWSLDGWAGSPQVKGYRDYSIWSGPQPNSPNLSQEEIDAKTEAFTAFTRHDWDICASGGECAPDEWADGGGLYKGSMSRQYNVDAAWREGYVEPLPAPYADNNRSGPYIRGRYKIKNVATGSELAVYNASQENGARLTTWTSTGTPNQTFEMRVHRRGWEISPLHSKVPDQDRWKCLDVPGQSQADGMQVNQFDCSPNPNADYPHQTLRVIRQPAGNFELVFVHSGMRLTAPPFDGGTVIQAAYNGSDYQKWVFVPA